MAGGFADTQATGGGGQRSKDKQSILPVNVKQVTIRSCDMIKRKGSLSTLWRYLSRPIHDMDAVEVTKPRHACCRTHKFVVRLYCSSLIYFVCRRYFQHTHFIPIVGVGKRGVY